uniref:CRM domain-containing protein n=1 Tax=Oryza punctata TaxID=4537 RepID=A0A0E0LAV0_ORYPU
MASLAPRLLLRRRPLLSAAAAAATALVHPSGSCMRLRGAGSRPPGASPLFEPPRGVSERWMDGRRWWFRQPVRHGSTAVTLDTDGGFARFSVGGDAGTKQRDGRKGQPPAKATKKMSRKAKVNQLKWYRLKAKKKMKSPNPEVRIRYKLEKAKRKEEWLIEKLRKYEVPRSPEPVHDPEILTEEEKFYLKRTGEKKKNYVPVGRRGVFGGVVLNMHLHWKKHETVKVICKPCRPGQVFEYAEELTRLSKGTVIDIKPNNTIIFYRGKNYVQPKVMSPPDTLSKQKALEKYRYEQSLEHTSQFIEKLEKELEDYQKHVALFKNRGETFEKISSEETNVDDLTTSSDTE